MLEYHLKMEKELEEELKYLEKQWNNAGVASKGDIENEIENVERKLHKRKQKIALVEAAKPPEEVHIEIFVLTALKAQILENLDEELANILPQERNGETLYQDWQPYLRLGLPLCPSQVWRNGQGFRQRPWDLIVLSPGKGGNLRDW